MKCPKILFVNPPYSEIYSSVSHAKGNANPINLAYLAAYLRAKQIEVEIFDANALQCNLAGLPEKLPRDFDAIGIASYAPSLHISVKVLEIARSINKKCITIMGGAHLTGDPIGTLQNQPVIDYGVIGEGEITLFELLSSIWDNQKPIQEVEGVVYRRGQEVILNRKRSLIKNLDELPLPAYDLLPMDRYSLPLHHISIKKVPLRPFSLVFTSRGCPFDCNFCASKVVWGQKVRYHSPERVLTEINLLKNKYNVETLEIADDTFTLSKKRMVQICEELIKRSVQIQFNCLSRVDNIKFGDMLLLKKAGCYLIRFGVESGSQTILDHMGKGISRAQIIRAFDLAKKAKIGANASFVLGTPKETWKTIEETSDLILKIKPDLLYFFYASPLVGTALRKEMLQKNLVKNDNWDEWDLLLKPMAASESMTVAELEQARKRLYKKAYFNLPYLFKKLIQIRSRKMMIYYLRGLLTVLTLSFSKTRT